MGHSDRILITGANGQLGKSLAAVFANTSTPFLCCDRSQLDITDYSAIIETVNGFKPSILINCAAFTHVDNAEKEPLESYAVNAFAPGLLAHLCRLHNIWLIHLSTDYVFDGKNSNYAEDVPPNPLSIYGRSKLAGEQVIKGLMSDYTLIRTAWLFGDFGGDFVSRITKAITTNPTVNVVSTEIGSPTYAGELAQAILSMTQMPNRESFSGQLFHFAGTQPVSRYQWATKIRDIIKSDTENDQNLAEINPVNDFPGAIATRPKNSSLNSGKLRALLCRPVGEWLTPLTRIIRDHRSNENR